MIVIDSLHVGGSIDCFILDLVFVISDTSICSGIVVSVQCLMYCVRGTVRSFPDNNVNEFNRRTGTTLLLLLHTTQANTYPRPGASLSLSSTITCLSSSIVSYTIMFSWLSIFFPLDPVKQKCIRNNQLCCSVFLDKDLLRRPQSTFKKALSQSSKNCTMSPV